MENAFYYLYETTNITNGKKYIGQHCTKDLNDGYYGSSIELKIDIENGNKYKVTIIKFFDNIFDLGDAECEEIRKKKAVNDPLYYNKSNRTFYNKAFEYGLSDITKDLIRIKATGKKASKETKSKMSYSRKGPKHPMYGKHHSNKTRQKISDANKGKSFLGENFGDCAGENNGMYGKRHSEESKQKMRKPKTEEHKKNLSKAWEKRRLTPVKKESIEKWHKSMELRKLKLQQ